MRYVAAYLLAALGGKDSPNAGDIKKILDSVGIEADDTRLDKVDFLTTWKNQDGSVRDEMLIVLFNASQLCNCNFIWINYMCSI